jgi:hypothetical protein
LCNQARVCSLALVGVWSPFLFDIFMIRVSPPSPSSSDVPCIHHDGLMHLWSLIYFPLWDAWVSCTASLVQYIESPLLDQKRQVESLVSLGNPSHPLLLPVAETATQATGVRPELYSFSDFSSIVLDYTQRSLQSRTHCIGGDRSDPRLVRRHNNRLLPGCTTYMGASTDAAPRPMTG